MGTDVKELGGALCLGASGITVEHVHTVLKMFIRQESCGLVDFIVKSEGNIDK